MNLHHSFIAERIAAQHCAELLARGPQPAELLPALTRSGARLARALAPALAGLLGGVEPAVTALPASELAQADLAGQIGRLAANTLFGRPGSDLALLASLDGATLLRLVDRAFGGRGETTGSLPERFPLSADMMRTRLETLLGESLGQALALPDLAALRRDSDLAALAPFAPGTPLAQLRLEVAEENRSPWQVLIALPLAQLPALFARGEADPAPRRAAPADPAAAPFADLPLPLVATLVEMRVPLATIAALQPGSVLPVAVARAVPLSAGDTVLARGTIGSADDRIALKLTLPEGSFQP